MGGKDPITCHILDTTAGRPARGVSVVLEGPSPSPSAAAAGSTSVKSFEAVTDDDGRVKAWQPRGGNPGGANTLVDVLADIRGPSRWTLRFDTAAYFGEDQTFFPEATIVFRVDEGQSYHVPLLLSPYSYTTYRGS